MAFLTPSSTRRAQLPGSHCHPRHWHILLCSLLLLLTWSGGNTVSRADEAAPSENQVKAAFLINFSKYVDWPAEALPETNSPITISCWGEMTLDDVLPGMLANKVVNGHPLVFKRLSSEGECTNSCQILFISGMNRRRLAEFLTKFRNTSVLTVGDGESFLDDGGIIRLARRDRKIRFEVNVTQASQAGLKISSKLLSVADAVKGNLK